MASKGHHKARSSLLLGTSPDTSYQPLSGSFSSATRNSRYVEPGSYYDRQGLPTPGLGSTKSKSKMYLPNSTWTWSFFGISVAQCVISLALEAYVFGEFQASLEGAAAKIDVDGRPSAALTIPTYLTIFIFGFLYQVGLVWDSLRLKNTIQVIGICLYNLGMLIYAAVEMNQVDDAIKQLVLQHDIHPDAWAHLRPFLIAAPCVIALGTVLLSFVAWKLYDEFAWSIYKHISADVRLKRRYLTYQVSSIAPSSFGTALFFRTQANLHVTFRFTSHSSNLTSSSSSASRSNSSSSSKARRTPNFTSRSQPFLSPLAYCSSPPFAFGAKANSAMSPVLCSTLRAWRTSSSSSYACTTAARNAS